ncbi:MAG: hypothetical protein GY835_02470 [bacterium]|nr:hypothetical protein [bacterium]
MSLREFAVLSALLSLILIVTTTGCNDDPTKPKSFAINITVLDEHGVPVEGAEIGCLPGIPMSQLARSTQKGASRTMIAIRYDVQETQFVKEEILDVTGEVIRTLVSDLHSPNTYITIWDGRTDADEPTPPGYYQVKLSTSIDGNSDWVEASVMGILQGQYSPGAYSVATTDADGKAVITDRRIVPAFWAPPELQKTSDTGISEGYFSLDNETTFFVHSDPSDPHSDLVHESIIAVDGPQSLTISLDGRSSPPYVENTEVQEVTEAGKARYSVILDPPYPNPFN